MKPLLIFQLHESMTSEKAKILSDIIHGGLDNGCLILDNSITILSFDKDGHLEYVTPRKDKI